MTAGLLRWAARTAIAAIACGLFDMAAVNLADASAPTAVDDFGSCLAATKTGDLLLLIDESYSLKTTDPAAARVQAANYLVNSLATYSHSNGISLNVAVSGFEDSYLPERGWTALDGTGSAATTGTISGLQNKNNGFDTDYWSALEGARRALAERTAALGGGSRCQAIAWFTDGQLDIQARTTADQRDRYHLTKPFAPNITLDHGDRNNMVEAATAAAAGQICRAGGLADQLRASGVKLLAIGLRSKDTGAGDFSLLKATATGSTYSGHPCGAVRSPAPGLFALADDIDGLLRAFDPLSAPGQPRIELPGVVCQRTVANCPNEGHAFVLDVSIKSVHILSVAGFSNPTLLLRPPHGQASILTNPGVGLRRGIVLGAGNTAVYAWLSPDAVQIDLTKPTGSTLAWSGQWQLTYLDPSARSAGTRSHSVLHITTDLFPSWPAHDKVTLHSGAAAVPVSFGLADSAQRPRSPKDLLGTLVFSAVLIADNGAQTWVGPNLDKTSLLSPVPMNLSTVKPGNYRMHVTLALTTAGIGTVPGTALTPQTADIPVSVGLPPHYPQVFGQLNFGTVTGTGTGKAELSVTGPGCVWIDKGAAPSIKTGPENLGTVVVKASNANSRSGCLRLTDGQRARLPVELKTEHDGNGSLTGTVALTLSPDVPGDPRSIPVSFIADLRKPVNSFHFWLALVIALILGPGIPLALLYAAKWYTARIPGQPLYVEQIPITVRDGATLRDGVPLAFTASDFNKPTAVAAGGARRVRPPGTQLELRTKIGISPVKPAYTVVALDGTVGASSDPMRPRVGKNGTGLARLPLAVHNKWAVLHDLDGPADQATLMVAVGNIDPRSRDAIASDASARAPAIVRQLRDGASGNGATRPSGPSTVRADEPDERSAAGFEDDHSAGPTHTPPTQRPGGGYGFEDDPFPDD